MDVFERALETIQARVSVSAPGRVVDKMAVAYSGGLDSAVLLNMVHAFSVKHGLTLFAFHIHHGLSPNADAWLLHCAQECARLGIAFDSRRVELSNRARSGTEQAARVSRYAALGDLCREHGAPLLLTAHHLDDQAETVLLHLLRGSGVAGLSGMEQLNAAPDLVGDSNILIGRPLLELSRVQLEAVAKDRQIDHIEDESNADVRYARNALRHKVMPVLGEYFPGFQQRFARSAQHAHSAQTLLEQLAAEDLKACLEGGCIDIEGLKKLDSARIDNVLRHWFALHGIRMPATAWLSEMRMQLLDAREDAQIRVTHADCEIRRHRNKIFITPRLDDGLSISPQAFRWSGEERMRFPQYGGSLCFDRVAEQGIDAAWLRDQALELRYRSGGETLKLALNRPSRSLKHHYQALDVPAWERPRLPLLMAAGRLLFAAGIGMNWKEFPVASDEAITLRWEKD